MPNLIQRYRFAPLIVRQSRVGPVEYVIEVGVEGLVGGADLVDIEDGYAHFETVGGRSLRGESTSSLRSCATAVLLSKMPPTAAAMIDLARLE